MSSKPRFEIAIEGSGLSPSDISARTLAELLMAASGIIDAVSKDRGVKTPEPSLVELRPGSAMYAFEIQDEAAQPVVDEVEHRIKTRGKDATPEVRRALDRLQRASRGIGSIRFKRGPHAKPIHVAPVIQESLAAFDSSTELHGKIVGVTLSRTGSASIRIQVDQGLLVEVSGDLELAKVAARMFLRPVRATVSYAVAGVEHKSPSLVGLEKWDPVDDEDVLDLFDELREELEGAGLQISASEWLEATEP